MEKMSEKAIAAEALFVEAEKAEERGDFVEAAKILRRAADLEHVGAQVSLGNFFSWGKGVSSSASQSAYWYRRAFRNGDESGAFNLGLDRAKQGKYRSAVFWLKRAAEMHSGEAVLELAKIYSRTPRGRIKATALLRAAQAMKPSEISEQAKEDAAEILASLR